MPRINPWLMSGFEQRFLPGYLRKHFHVLACNGCTLTDQITGPGTSLVVYCNHASWWDPMVAMYVRSRLLPHHRMYAPIDTVALEQYKIFKSMGFFGVDKSHRGTTAFLQQSLQLLESPGTSLWITPEGRFCDPREPDVPLQPGLAHLAHKIQRTTNPSQSKPAVWFVPAAIEYVFWEERLPECLCWFGEPVQVQWSAAQPQAKSHWQGLLTAKLRAAQQYLATASIQRNTTAFDVLLTGKAGSWRLYDAARSIWAKIRGQKISLEHSGQWGARLEAKAGPSRPHA